MKYVVFDESAEAVLERAPQHQAECAKGGFAEIANRPDLVPL
jgi:hypothetical protein